MNLLYPSSNFERQIKNNKVFIQSTDKWKESLLSVRKCYYFTRMQSKLNILPHNLESVLYNIFSNYIHSLELGLGYDFFRGNKEMYSGYYPAILSIRIMILYGSIVLKDYISRRNLKKEVSSEELLFLSSLITYEDIEGTLVEWKDKFDINKIYENIVD